MKNILSIFLISIGSFLEVYYYAWKYMSEGDSDWLAIVKGIALTLLTMTLALKLRRHWGFYALLVIAVAYSIFCTSSGQATAYANRYNNQYSDTQNKIQQREDALAMRDQLYDEIDTLTELKTEKEKARDEIPIEKRKSWQFIGNDSDGDPRYQETESDVFVTLNNEIAAYEQRIETLKQQAVSIEIPDAIIVQKETDSYAILNDMTGLPETLLQYLLQSMFSLFAAIMGPIGVSMLSPVRKEKRAKEQDIEPFVRFWVRWSWYMVRNGKGETILPKKSLLQYAKKEMPMLTEEIYNKIEKAAISAKSIDNNQHVCHNDESKAIDDIMEVLNVKRGRDSVRREKKGVRRIKKHSIGKEKIL